MGLTVGIHQIRAQAIGSPARGYTRMGSARKKVRVRARLWYRARFNALRVAQHVSRTIRGRNVCICMSTEIPLFRLLLVRTPPQLTAVE